MFVVTASKFYEILSQRPVAADSPEYFRPRDLLNWLVAMCEAHKPCVHELASLEHLFYHGLDQLHTLCTQIPLLHQSMPQQPTPQQTAEIAARMEFFVTLVRLLGAYFTVAEENIKV